MHLVQTAVEASLVVDIGRLLAVVPQRARAARDSLIRCKDGPSVAERAKILRRVKADGCDLADGANAATLKASPDRLSTVFDDSQVELFPEGLEPIEIDAVPIKVHRNHEADPPITRQKLPAPIEVE